MIVAPNQKLPDVPFTIVGSGPASMTLALKFEEYGIPCLMLEAGGFDYTPESQDFYRAEVVGDALYDLAWNRLRYFGGTSGHWTGWCRPLDAEDLRSWPITHADLAGHLDEACRILEIKGGFIRDRRVLPNFDQVEFQFSLPPVRFGQKYRQRIVESRLIAVALNTPVLEIVGSGDGVLREVVVSRDGSRAAVPVKSLIVGAGGIENSRLLLWSQQRATTGFLANLSIGTHWMEHPHFTTGEFVGDSESLSRVLKLDEGLGWASSFFLATTSAFRQRQRVAGASVRLKVYEEPVEGLKRRLEKLLCLAPALGRRIAGWADKNILCGAEVRMAWEQLPHAENRIVLDPANRDAFGVPRLKLHWRLHDEVRETALQTMFQLGRDLVAANAGRIGVLPYLTDKLPFPPRDERGGRHHMGGTRMGTGPGDGVVDRDLRVFGTRNLYVAGSSVFRTGGYANPTLSIVQLSLRLADHLRRM